MSIKDGHHGRVSFDTRDELGNKIDKLAVMIGKLATKKVEQICNSDHKLIRVEVKARTEIIVKETTKIGRDKITD